MSYTRQISFAFLGFMRKPNGVWFIMRKTHEQSNGKRNVAATRGNKTYKQSTIHNLEKFANSGGFDVVLHLTKIELHYTAVPPIVINSGLPIPV